jgi:sec-independent protein translocase protein TatA
MFGSSEMIIVLVIVLVLFGGSQLPKLAKNLGKAQKEFKDGIAEADVPKNKTDAAAAQVAATPPPVAPAPVADPPPPPPPAV